MTESRIYVGPNSEFVTGLGCCMSHGIGGYRLQVIGCYRILAVC